MLPLTDYVLIDIETAARDDARKWVQADSRLVDKAKIAQSIEERAEKLALDPNGARIVCVGMWTHQMPEPSVMACPDILSEKRAIDFLWDVWRSLRRDARFVGFRARTFDLRILIQRSRYLGLKTPPISTAPYGRGEVLDLFDELTFDNDRDATNVVPRTLSVFCEQFGIYVRDEYIGKDMAALVAAEDWAGVEAHNLADLYKTKLLAERIGAIKAPQYVGAV
jgi:hypothetical protein